MKKLFRSLLSFIAAMHLSMASSLAADTCIAINAGKTGRALVNKPGNYCLVRDLKIDGSYNPLVWEGVKYHSDDLVALVIAANDVAVNLGGKTIRSDAQEVLAGVQSALVNTGESTQLGDGPAGYRKISWDAAYRNITIRNGTININRGSLGLMFPGSGNYYGKLIDGFPVLFWPANTRARECDDFSIDILPPAASEYPIRHISLDTLKIHSPNCGVVVQGASTVLRNSVIETESLVGIWSFGPNAVIENNTIIVHATASDSTYPASPHHAAIRLHQADGTIVRNNRIVMRTGLFSRDKGAAAIDLLDSKNVVIENNTIEGFSELLRKDSASSSAQKNNTLK
jgi:hypothetical protein